MLFNNKADEISPSLINKVIDGDESAFEFIYNHISGKIYAICLRYSSNNEEASTIFKNVFFNIHSNLINYTFKESFAIWAMDIAVITCLNINKKQIDNNFLVEDMMDVTTVKDIETNKAFSILPNNELIKALQDLRVSYRTILNLYHIEGYSHVRISEILGISIETSKIQKKLAEENLDQRLFT